MINYQHKNLAAGRWNQLSLLEQMANIGSEVERALNWRAQNNTAYCQRATERALELLDLTAQGTKNPAHRKELTRVREALADYFFGANQFISSDALWKKYFSHFANAVRKNY
jgi:NTP pyrophosphatase (non-canonical NTP hydrolase)